MTVLALSIALSLWSAFTLWLQTHGTPERARWACVSGLGAQGLFLVFDWMVGAYGLMPLALIYGAMYVRGWLRWKETGLKAATASEAN